MLQVDSISTKFTTRKGIKSTYVIHILLTHSLWNVLCQASNFKILKANIKHNNVTFLHFRVKSRVNLFISVNCHLKQVDYPLSTFNISNIHCWHKRTIKEQLHNIKEQPIKNCTRWLCFFK